MKKKLKLGDIVESYSKTKKSQRWTKRGRIIKIDEYGFKAVVHWDHPHRTQLIEMGQLHPARHIRKRRMFV